MADEWTFVSPRKASKRRPPRPTHANGPHAAGGGLYGASVDAGAGQADGARDVHRTEEEERKEREQTRGDVLECLRALEEQLQFGRGFASRLISAMSMASSAINEDGDGGGATTGADVADQATIAESRLRLREIVAYGIGNFATGRFHAPMLQLACLLLLRRCACGDSLPPTKDDGDVSDVLEREQRQVPIYYYEPCILSAEKELLETAFHLNVLETNDMGKRTVESMRQPRKEQTECTDDATRHTLFYMPHCPMRLYCNVLWAHWDRIFSTTPSNETSNNPILIFGNSFRGYDEGVISTEERSDPTNGVLRIVPFARELPTSGKGNSRRREGEGEIIPDALRHLEMAFNDCNVISLTVPRYENEPDRPKEWDSSRDGDESGELR